VLIRREYYNTRDMVYIYMGYSVPVRILVLVLGAMQGAHAIHEMWYAYMGSSEPVRILVLVLECERLSRRESTIHEMCYIYGILCTCSVDLDVYLYTGCVISMGYFVPVQ